MIFPFPAPHQVKSEQEKNGRSFSPTAKHEIVLLFRLWLLMRKILIKIVRYS